MQIPPYSPIAHEYYDPIRHPTCANFEQLSRNYLVSRVQIAAGTSGRILEVGTGRSVAAPAVAEIRPRLDELVLLDLSHSMLEHSRNWENFGTQFVVADARDTGLPSASFKLLVASLGDPYNTPKFWLEVQRLLEIGGVCLFTTPSHEWADRFRPNTQRSEAEFVLASGSVLLVPSYIPSLNEQVQMIENAGFRLEETQPYFIGDISGPISPKLMSTARECVMRGFMCTRLN